MATVVPGTASKHHQSIGKTSQLKSTHTIDSFSDLTDKIQRGDKSAFKELFIAYYEPLCDFANRYTECEHTAEEIVQDIFTYIWENRDHWQPDNPNAWLYKTTSNKALDIIKHRQVREKNSLFIKETYESSHKMAPDQSMHTKDFEEAAQQAIEELPEKCRITYILHRREALSYAEIANVMDVSKKTVETQMSRALMLLRQKLQPYLILLLTMNIL